MTDVERIERECRTFHGPGKLVWRSGSVLLWAEQRRGTNGEWQKTEKRREATGWWYETESGLSYLLSEDPNPETCIPF